MVGLYKCPKCRQSTQNDMLRCWRKCPKNRQSTQFRAPIACKRLVWFLQTMSVSSDILVSMSACSCNDNLYRYALLSFEQAVAESSLRMVEGGLYSQISVGLCTLESS
jgi:hypothetical protein